MNPLYETLDYDKYLTKFLQKNVRIILEDRVIRQGHLVLYGFKNYQIQLFFKGSGDKLRKTEIPIPFKMNINKGDLELSYNVPDLLPPDILRPSKNKTTKNKFLHKTLTIQEK